MHAVPQIPGRNLMNACACVIQAVTGSAGTCNVQHARGYMSERSFTSDKDDTVLVTAYLGP